MITLPCDRCDRMPEVCPCIVEPMALRRATVEVERRHAASVHRAYFTDALTKRPAAS